MIDAEYLGDLLDLPDEAIAELSAAQTDFLGPEATMEALQPESASMVLKAIDALGPAQGQMLVEALVEALGA